MPDFNAILASLKNPNTGLPQNTGAPMLGFAGGSPVSLPGIPSGGIDWTHVADGAKDAIKPGGAASPSGPAGSPSGPAIDIGNIFTGSPGGNGPFGSGIGGFFGGNNRPKSDSTGEVQSIIDKYSPEFASALTNGSPDGAFHVNTGTPINSNSIDMSGHNVTAKGVNWGNIDTSSNVQAQRLGGPDARSPFELLDINANQPDAAALDALRTKGLAAGPSAAAQAAMGQNRLDLLQNKDLAGANALAGRDQALSSLAMRGGLGGGAAERIGENAGRGMNAAQQAAQRQYQGANLGVSLADEQNKNQLLGLVSNQDLSRAQYGSGLNQFNINTGLDVGRTNIANDLASQQYNRGMTSDLQKFNASNNLGAQQFNANNDLAAQQYNTNLNFDTKKFNEANYNAAQQFNSGQEFQRNLANQNVAVGDLFARNQFNLGKYGQQIQGYGSSRTADAIANGGKK